MVDGVGQEVLPHHPRPLGARLGQCVRVAQHVAGLQIPQRRLGDRPATEMRIGVGVAVGVHVLQQSGRRAGGHVRAQRPGGVGVADAPDQVGHVLEHVCLVGEPVLWLDLGAVHGDPHAAECLQLQAGGGHDDVGVEVPAGLEHDAGCVDVVDMVGDHLEGALADLFEHIAVGHQAHALVPRVVSRLEVHVHRIVPRQHAGVLRPDDLLGHARRAAGDHPHQLLEGQRDRPDDRVGSLARQELSDRRQRRIHPRHRQQISGGALQHGHVRGLAGQGGHQRDRGGSTADDDHLLAGVVEVLRPELRVHHRAGEVGQAGEFRGVGLGVVVVAGAEEHQAAAVGLALAVLGDVHRPGVGGRVPVRRGHRGVEADVRVDAVLAGGALHVVTDLIAVGHVFVATPRLPRPAEREDRGVRAHARVAEQVPGAADAVALFEDDVTGGRIGLGESVGRPDPGDSGADDDDVVGAGVGLNRTGVFMRGDGHRGPRCSAGVILTTVGTDRLVGPGWAVVQPGVVSGS